VYELEASDEWANLAAEVRDNVQIDRVEFYLDDELVDFSVVEPYAVKWVLQMRDLRPSANTASRLRDAHHHQSRRYPDHRSRSWLRWVDDQPRRQDHHRDLGERLYDHCQQWQVLTESHLMHVVAYDAAGNETESEPVRFYVIHKPKDKKILGDDGALPGHEELLAWRDDLLVPAWWRRVMS
jgi:hypothetical protein